MTISTVPPAVDTEPRALLAPSAAERFHRDVSTYLGFFALLPPAERAATAESARLETIAQLNRETAAADCV